MFDLIPTDPDEYKVYADWLEDQGVILTKSIRAKILPLDNEYGNGRGDADKDRSISAICYPDGWILTYDKVNLSNFCYGIGCDPFGCTGEAWNNHGLGNGLTWNNSRSGEGCKINV